NNWKTGTGIIELIELIWNDWSWKHWNWNDWNTETGIIGINKTR
ncbi:22002_t:CDS:2, partial [Cetraspora pellucida]